MIKYENETNKRKKDKKLSIKVLAIINPASGKGNIVEHIDEIKENLKNQDMETEVHLTKKEYNAKKIIEDNIEGKDLILVCVADGTFNDLAKSLEMPIKDISITKRLLQSKARVIDIGEFNNKKFFCYV